MKILEHETKWHTTRLTTIEDDICTTGYLMAECNKNKVCSRNIIFLLIFWVMRDFAYSLATNRLTIIWNAYCLSTLQWISLFVLHCQ